MTEQKQAKGKQLVSDTRYSHQELWNWTLTKAAVASCRIRDIFELRECSGAKTGVDPDFYWLGRVPCRTVLFYGIVVGVQPYETRTLYTVDDGSAAIECNLRHSVQHQFEQQSPRKKAKLASGQASSSTLHAAQDPPPKPIARVGDVVRVVGRVLNRHKTRLINVEMMELRKNANVEPQHWLHVTNLYESWYYASDKGPFIIPPPLAIPVPGSPSDPSAASKEIRAGSSAPTQSPSRSSVASSAPSSPSSVASTSTTGSHKSPPRLRHPSRLHTHDLTTNTFRIYVKHYMDNAPQEHMLSDTEDTEDIENMPLQLPETPTKRRASRTARDDETPRPSYKSRGRLETETPKLHSRPGNDEEDEEYAIQGFTLSHLRCVPELVLLAKRVVEAEAKRRAREERKRQKEAGAARVPSSSKSLSRSSASVQKNVIKEKLGEPLRVKMKRLFSYAIRQLYDEGSIILWDGAVRPSPQPRIPAPSFTTSAPISSSTLWKMSSGHLTTADSTIFSSVTQLITSTTVDDDDDDEGLSDPSPNEEAYIPLTPSYFATIVEHAMRDMIVLRRRAMTAKMKSKSTAGPSAIEIARMMQRPVEGPTAAEIAEHLKRRDEKWRRVGEWAVKESLQWASERGRVWHTGDGKWNLCA